MIEWFWVNSLWVIVLMWGINVGNVFLWEVIVVEILLNSCLIEMNMVFVGVVFVLLLDLLELMVRVKVYMEVL